MTTTPFPADPPAPSPHALRIAAELGSTLEQVEAGHALAFAGILAVLREMAEEDRAEEEAA